MVKGIGLILVKVFAEMIENLKDRHAKNLADSVMQISVSENKGLYNRLLEEDRIFLESEGLIDIM